jgi:hypothetical protein
MTPSLVMNWKKIMILVASIGTAMKKRQWIFVLY